MRARFGDAVIVLELVGHLQRTAGLALRILGERNGRRHGRGSRLNFHCGWPEGARTCAVPSPAMVKCRSLVPFGACSVGAISVTPPPATTSRVPPLERTSSVLPAGTGNGPATARCGLLVGRRQDDRRLAGIDRRRHPGVDPDIGRRQHAVPVERRRDRAACAHRPRRHRSRPSSRRPARAAPRGRESAAAATAGRRGCA